MMALAIMGIEIARIVSNDTVLLMRLRSRTGYPVGVIGSSIVVGPIAVIGSPIPDPITAICIAERLAGVILAISGIGHGGISSAAEEDQRADARSHHRWNS